MQIIHVKKGFKLKKDNIWLGFTVSVGSSDRIQYFFYVFLAVIFGTVDTSVENTDSEAISKAVVIVSVGQIAEIFRNDAGVVKYGGKSENDDC